MALFTYQVQRAVTKAWLERELPLVTDGPEWSLSAAGTLTGTLPLSWRDLHSTVDQRPLLEEDGTLIHVDASGEHRGAYLVTNLSVNEAGELLVEASGFASYAFGNLYTGDNVALNADPADLVRHIWAHLQSFPDGNLGVEVVGKTSVRVGTPAVDAIPGSGPHLLSWWDSPDCGEEMQRLAQETPFDWIEETEWVGEDAQLRLRIGHPRIGRRRTDLAFVEGENIGTPTTPDRDGSRRVSELHGLGAGEGRGSLRQVVTSRDGRLRRAGVLLAKDISNLVRLASITRAEHTRLQPTERVGTISVRDHPNARIGSWTCGDDIRVQALVPHFGAIDMWCRIVSWRLAGEHSAVLTLERSDLYNYGR